MNESDAVFEFNERYKKCPICAKPVALLRTLEWESQEKPVKTVFEAHYCKEHAGPAHLVPGPFDSEVFDHE